MTTLYDLTEFDGALDDDMQILVDCPSRSPRGQRMTLAAYAQKAETLVNKTLGAPGQQSPAYVTTLRVGLDGTDLLWRAQKTVAWTPGSISAATGVTLSVPIAGAAVGDHVSCCALSDHDGVNLTGRITSADTATIKFFNAIGTTVILPALFVSVVVSRFRQP